MGALDILEQGSQTHWVNPVGSDDVYSDPLSPAEAEFLKKRFVKSLSVEVRALIEDPTKVRVYLKAKEINKLFANKRLLLLPNFAPPSAPIEVLTPLLPTLPNPSSRLNISDEEWRAAEEFFKDPKNKIKGKMRKKDALDYDPKIHKGQAADPQNQQVKKDATRHSFLYINGRIYAVANGEYRTGSGSFGNVKVIQDRMGNSDVVKVENYDEKMGRLEQNEEGDIEKEIGERVDMVKGEMVRPLMTQTLFKQHYTKHKLYSILENRGQEELFDVITISAEHLFIPSNGLPYAIQCCDAIQALHDRRILHRDVKPENFMVDKNGQVHTVNAIDFGLSTYLPEGQRTLTTNRLAGTKGYAAPEVMKNRQYQFTTDVYALGIFFPYLAVPEAVSEQMVLDDPNHRMTLGAVKAHLIDELRATPNLNAQAQQMIADHDAEVQATFHWLANRSGTTADIWLEDHSGNNVVVKSKAMSYEDALDLLGSLKNDNDHVQIVQNPQERDKFEIHIDGQELRAVMLKEKKLEKFNQLSQELRKQVNQDLMIDVVDRDDNYARGVHLNLSASLNNLGHLFAIRDALLEMRIPFKLVQGSDGTQPILTIALQDNVLNKIPNANQWAKAIVKQQRPVEEIKEFQARYALMQQAVEKLQALGIQPQPVIRAQALLAGRYKEMHIELIVDSYIGVELRDKLNELGLNPDANLIRNSTNVRIVFKESDIATIAQHPILDQVVQSVRQAEQERMLQLERLEQQNKATAVQNNEKVEQKVVTGVIVDMVQRSTGTVILTEQPYGSGNWSITGKVPSDLASLRYALKLLNIEDALTVNDRQYEIKLPKDIITSIAQTISRFPTILINPQTQEANTGSFMKECAIGAILGTSIEDLKVEYQQQATQDASTRAGRWMVGKAKKAGDKLWGKNEDRDKQMDFLVRAFNDINSQNNLSVIEKATHANCVLHEVEKMIAQKQNMFEPKLKRLCEAKRAKLFTEHGASVKSKTDSDKILNDIKERIDRAPKVAKKKDRDNRV